MTDKPQMVTWITKLGLKVDQSNDNIWTIFQTSASSLHGSNSAVLAPTVAVVGGARHQYMARK